MSADDVGATQRDALLDQRAIDAEVSDSETEKIREELGVEEGYLVERGILADERERDADDREVAAYEEASQLAERERRADLREVGLDDQQRRQDERDAALDQRERSLEEREHRTDLREDAVDRLDAAMEQHEIDKQTDTP
jgi:hypothetical protein